MAHSLLAMVFAVASTLLPVTLNAADGPPFVPLEDVRPGDRCVGKSVFSGTTVEEFEMEVLGVVRGTAPGSDLIIARAEGEFLEATGIAQGMSGSPVYLDGRLVGAISATWPFSKEPIAGITPIGEMLPALDPPDGSETEKQRGSLGLLLMPEQELPRSAIARVSRLVGIGPAAAQTSGESPLASYDGRQLSSMPLPLTVPGGARPLISAATGVLRELGFSPVQGVSGGIADPPRELIPGSSVGVRFVGGDMDWTAIGTLTYSDGERVLAFGHPVLNAGPVELPMVSAYVHAVLPLASVSFKYASGGATVGTIDADRRRGVGGAIGTAAVTLPVTVTVSPRGSAPSEYDFEVARTRPFSSVFAGLAVAGAVTEAAQSSGRASVGLSATLETTRGPVTYRAVFQTAEPALRAGGELAALLDVVMDGAFEGVEVTGASLLVEIDGGEFLDVIEGVTADRAVYRPGDQVRLVVSLRDRDGARTERAFALLVPEGTPRGWLTVRIGGASSFHEWDAERLGQGLRPRTWDQMRELIESSLPGNTVVAQLLSGRQGLSLSGSEMGRVPGKAALVMGSVRQSGTVVPAELTVLSGQSFRTDSEAVGFHEFIVYVDPDE